MEVRASRLIAAAPEHVLRALTDPDELARWSGVEAEITDSLYLLRGESVPTGALGGRLLAASDRGLRFEWPLAGEVSQVEIELEPVPQGGDPPADYTRVSVHHRGIPKDALPARCPEESWQCLWVLWLRLLQGWVERAEALPRFSFRPPFGAVVERSVEIDAPPERVWAALVDPALRQRWLGVPLGPELRREEGRLLVCAFELEQPATTVTWRLEPLPGGRTRVTLREEGLTCDAIDNHLGWHDWLVALALEVARPRIRQTVAIAAPPDRVWPWVGTEEGLRRWYAGSIHLRPEAGSPVALGEDGRQGRGRVVEVVPERLLRFAWTVAESGWSGPELPGAGTEGGGPLQTVIELQPEGRGTRVWLTHSGFERLPAEGRLEVFERCRRAWAAGDRLQALKRLAEGAMEPIRLHLNARREHVFAAWTRPELLVRWWGPDAQAEVDLRVGGRYRLSMQFEWGALVCVREYREIVPPERLVFTFAWEGDPSGEETRVTLLLREVEGGTELILRHEGFGDARVAEHHRAGWLDCVGRLAAIAPAIDGAAPLER